jgi:hypothetical protein
MHDRCRRDPKVVQYDQSISGIYLSIPPTSHVPLAYGSAPEECQFSTAQVSLRMDDCLANIETQNRPTNGPDGAGRISRRSLSPRTSSPLPLSSIHKRPADPTGSETPVPAPTLAHRLLTPGGPRPATDAVRDPPVRSIDSLVEGEVRLWRRGIPRGGGGDDWVRSGERVVRWCGNEGLGGLGMRSALRSCRGDDLPTVCGGGGNAGL